MPQQKEMNISATGALRDNKGKLPYHWFPGEAVHATVSVLWRASEPGGGKYPPHNWRKGANWSVPLDSCFRHLYALAGGEFYDQETKLPHAWHALTNLVFLVYYMARFPELNDLAAKESK
jgi:hypothetical protein